MSRPPSLFTSVRRPMGHAWNVMPKVSTQVYMLDCKIWKLFRPRGNGERGKMWSVLLSNIQFLWFLQSMFLLLCTFTNDVDFVDKASMQKSVTTVCLHCSFARLKNKHIGVLGTNVATISWLHWSPVSGYTFIVQPCLIFKSEIVRGTPTAGVLLHWVIISRRWERIQKRDSESPINTDSPRKKSAPMQWLNREITGPKNTQNWHHFTRTSSSTHSNYLCLLTLLHLVLLSPLSM